MTNSMRSWLRQGRGAGFLAALNAGGGASDDLLDCVLHDPRWDRQIEARDAYYAQLLISTGTDIEILRRRVVGGKGDADEAEAWLTISVLAEMSRRRAESARRALAEGIEVGPWWRACFDALEAAGGIALVSQVVTVDAVRALVARVDIDDVFDAVATVAAPWEQWATQVPALESVVRDAQGTREVHPMSGPVAWAASRLRAPRVAGELAQISTEQLLAQGRAPGVSDELVRRADPEAGKLLLAAARGGPLAERRAALQTLGNHGVLDLLADAEAFLRWESALAPSERHDHLLRQGYLRYLEALPPKHVLPLARRWFLESWPLSLAGERILSRHATPEDIRMLEAAGVAALGSTDMYRLCSIVEAIGVAGPDSSLALLNEIYDRAPYSHARRRVVSALRACRITGSTRERLTEALWDCEPESRELACGAADEADGAAMARVRTMACDAHEDGRVRDAARKVAALQV